MSDAKSAKLTLSSVLKRTNKAEMKMLLTSWGKLPLWKINFSQTKYELIQDICQICEEHDLSVKYANELDLLYVADFPHKKYWRAYKMTQPTGNVLTEEQCNANYIRNALEQKLYVSFSCSVSVMEKEHFLWGRVGIPDIKQVVYFIHFPTSKFLLFTKRNNKLKSLVQNALRRILGFKSIEDLPLSSPHPAALAQILLHSSDPHDSYEYDKGRYRPVQRLEEEHPLKKTDSRVNICDAGKLARNKRILDHQFGDKIQPCLTSLVLETETRFRGTKYLPTVPGNSIIKCKTTISGPNVLEGLRKLALLGYAKAPLPRFLTNISKTGRQCFKITDAARDDESRHSA
uniref:Centromere protein N-like n=1 Tax=Ciona intestinalis TaxID=7719 RepID=F7BMV4_CIOIN|nr:centromere protein N-like [Ciona intestinalis]|eukprot:XP_002129120.1 centromere protein N-like [Ciona intestinalis]